LFIGRRWLRNSAGRQSIHIFPHRELKIRENHEKWQKIGRRQLYGKEMAQKWPLAEKVRQIWQKPPICVFI